MYGGSLFYLQLGGTKSGWIGLRSVPVMWADGCRMAVSRRLVSVERADSLSSTW